MSSIESTVATGRVSARPDRRSDPLSEFESQLHARRKVPLERMDDFLCWPAHQVRREAQTVGRVLRRFADAVVKSMEEPAAAGEFLRDLDLKVISRDHDWRAVFSAIQARDEGFEDYKQALLIKYLQYLSFRKRLLDFICSHNLGLEDTDEMPGVYMGAGGGAGDGEVAARGSVNGVEGAPEGFARLPMGESRELHLTPGSSLHVMLAGHRFRLVGGEPPVLIDPNGRTSVVRRGRNMVGRHPQSDLPVDQNFSFVSRAHCVLEWGGEDMLVLTDLSSRGTFLEVGEAG